MSNYLSASILDRIRRENGSEYLKSYFSKLAKENREKALSLLNAESLQFCTLFILQPDIKALGVEKLLNPRNSMALELSDLILAKNTSEMHRLTATRDSYVQSTLKWIFETGQLDDGLNNCYDEIIELTSLILIKTYKDNSILQNICDMIFSRNRKGQLIHHLMWAFFETHLPDTLYMAAKRLCSDNADDVELAYKILDFLPCINPSRKLGRLANYYNTLHWLQENYPFLQYTGEGFHLTNRPIPYTLSRESKYICRPISHSGTSTDRAYPEHEQILIGQFMKLADSDRVFLSDFSYMLYLRNKSKWNSWIHYPVTEQLRIAKASGGGSSW